MTVLISLVFAFQADQVTIDRLLVQLGDESIEVRTNAEESIIRRARTWTKEDVERLRKAVNDPMPDRAIRARNALKWVDWFRELPEELWKAVPDLARRLRSEDGREIGETVDHLQDDKPKVSHRGLIPLLIGLLEDPRDSGQINWSSSHMSPGTLTVGQFAADVLRGVLPHFRREPTRKEASDWWSANQDKRECDWHLPDLSAKEEWIRAPAIRKLIDLGDETLIPRILEVLPSLKDASAFAYAVGGFSKFPADVRAKALKASLRDARFEARWAAAQVLLEPCPREAVDAMIETLEDPAFHQEASRWPWNLRNVCAWLAASGDGKAVEALYRCGRSGPGKCCAMAILALRKVGDRRVEERLSEATSDPTTDWIPEGYDVAPMAAPRVCDAAALVLSERLGIGADFTWPASIRTRNRNIEIILNRWRRSKGLPPVEYLGPGIEPVPSEKVRGLVPELISAEVAVREAAIVKLSELGPGAWRTLLGEIERAPDASRSVLEASTTRAANTLRSVVFENAAAERLAPGLKSRMHRPIDVNALVNLIGEPWFDDPDSGKLMCVVSRGADGIGVSIRLSLEPPCPPGSRTVGIEFEYGGGSSWSRLEGGVPFRTDFRQRLERISTVLDRPDLQAEVEFTVERTFKD